MLSILYKRVVGGVLQQPAHQVAHSRDEITHGAVHPGTYTKVANGGMQRGGHAVQYLHLISVDRKIMSPGRGNGESQTAQVVAGERRADMAGRSGHHHSMGAPLIVGVTVRLHRIQRAFPTIGPSGDGLGVPVRPLHQSDLQRRGQRVGRPTDECFQIVRRILAIRLHHASEHRPIGIAQADLAQQCQRCVLGLIMLGVEVHDGPYTASQLQDGFQALHGLAYPFHNAKRAELRGQGGGLHTEVDARKWTELIMLEQGTVRPRWRCRHQ